MSKKDNSASRDVRVLKLYEELIEIEQRLIPTGLHILGKPSPPAEKADVLKMVAAFDRPELGARALPDLVALDTEDKKCVERALRDYWHAFLAGSEQ